MKRMRNNSLNSFIEDPPIIIVDASCGYVVLYS